MKSLCIGLLLLASLHMPVHAAGAARAFHAETAVCAFHDHCVLNRSAPKRFAEAIDAIATPMDVYSADAYAMGERGQGWWLREGNAVFFRTPLARCRMFILSEKTEGLQAAFDRMAKHPPASMASHAFQHQGQTRGHDFIWTRKIAHSAERATRIQLLPGRKDGLDPPAASWILTADDHIEVPAPVILDPAGLVPGAGGSRLQR